MTLRSYKLQQLRIYSLKFLSFSLYYQFLQKIYREDLDELVDEADYEMYKNRKAARDTVRYLIAVDLS